MAILKVFQVIFGSIFVLFLPGIILSFIFFKYKENEINWFERIVLSMVVSMAVVPFVVFFLNLTGVKTTVTSIILEILGISILGLVVIFLQKKFFHKVNFFKKSK